MRHLTIADLATIVRTLPDVFESHDVIRGLMTSRPRDYVLELHAYCHTDDPIQVAHARIGRALHGVPDVVATRRPKSPNVRGRSTKNQQWKKVRRL